MAKLVINNDKKMSTIAPEIYGHFSEHLGRCIYECQRNAHRCGGSIKRNEDSGAALAGRMLCRRISLDGRYRTESIQKENDQYTLGRCCRGQQLRNTRVL